MQDAPSLYGRAGLFKGITIPLPGHPLALGRDPAGKGRLAFPEDSDISRTHCTIRYDSARCCFGIVDHGSSNGTFTMPEDRRLPPEQEVFCRPGQQVRLGRNTVFELVAASQAQAPMPTDGLPRLAKGQRLDLASIRVPYERLYFFFVCIPAGLVLLGFLFLGYQGLLTEHWENVLVMVTLAVVLTAMAWFGWRYLLAMVLGHGIRVGPSQYPQIHALVSEASELLGIAPPTVVILQGHGLFEILVARRFSRRGLLLITSAMLDDLTEHGSSRELMFFIGRQLGLIASGYFRYWFFKHTLGQFAGLFYLAWLRRCHLTADRLGLLVCGDALAAEQSLVLITAGSGVAANTNIQAIREQRADLFDSVWSWIILGLSHYPYMVDRMIRLQDFAAEAAKRRIPGNAPAAIGALPLHHRSIRALPLIIVHGHDLAARLELVNFLHSKFPHVKPVLMIDETDAASSLPEKFERLGNHARGALALLTPDDLAMSQVGRTAIPRARQNVILEIGWIWARLGRQRMLLLTRGNVEMPSDMSGVDVHSFRSSPVECSEAVRDFIAGLEVR